VAGDPRHALIAQDYRDVVLSHQRESHFGVTGRENFVVFFEKMFERREDEQLVVED
jgi:hypothetical protein